MNGMCRSGTPRGPKLCIGFFTNTPCAATPDELAEHAAGLVCLTGDGRGPLAHALHSSTWRETLHIPSARNKASDPSVLVEWLLDAFGPGNVYAELQRHLIREE